MNLSLPIRTAGLSAEFHRAARTRDLEDIAQYLVVEKTKLAPAHAIFIFGNAHVTGPSSKVAAELYHDGFAPVIIASGGKPALSGDQEAHEIYTKLRHYGVPAHAILVEDRSENTQQNVLFSRAMYEDAYPSIAADSLICIGNAIAGRRFPMTVTANWPEITLPMIDHVWCEENATHLWRQRTDLQQEIVAQFDRIAPYIEAGFIKEIDLTRINAEAERRLYL